ncbi:MAG: hypothetical protein Q8R10_12245 [Pseudomonas sp.]|uniref:DUF6160 family protein n=1 Tax=Pseudomonas sp. TaxID=306 RepID=UPI0027343FE5|nr:DUF6160 family protein [Pseudomonas sp.]MDP3847181.1 hypothetical protein [Pseudomonas sp.]
MRSYWLWLPLVLSPLAQAMQVLDDVSLAGVSGQNGISMETTGGGWSAASVNYSQDGQTLSVKGVSSRPQSGASVSTTSIDVVGDQLQIEHSASPSVFSVENIEMAGSGKSFGSFRAFYTLGASLKLKGGGASGVSGFAVGDSKLSLTDVTFYYRDNGFDLIVKGASFDTYLNNAYIDIVGGGSANAVKLDLGTSRLVANIAGIGLDLAHGDPVPGVLATPGAPDTRDANASRSFGKLNMDLRLGGSISIGSGGASGEGLRITPNISIANSLFQYQDEGVLRAENFAGTLSSTSGLSIDLEQDGVGSYAKVAFQDLKINATLGGLIIGNPTNQKLGSLAFDLNFIDQGAKQNWLKLRAGGDPNSGLKGVTTDLSWNLANSSVSLTDNGSSIYFSGLRTNGTGQFSFDLTKSCAAGVSTSCYAGSQSDMSKGNYNGHFDGLRFGLNNVKGSYSFDGLRVGSAASPLQGGTELLVLMEVFPAYDFTLNGQLTIRPGGSVGDGLRYNADFLVTEGNAALTVDENGKGLWLSGTSYDMHFRDGSLDVSNNGIELRKGTYWSKLDVSDVRWGDRTAGVSLGRIVLKRYEQGSTLTLSSGGAGALCVGASGASSSVCSAAGGRWEDRGNEGVTVKLKNVFVKDTSTVANNQVSSNEKRNQLIVETDRSTDANGKAINGTGSQLVLDNFYTSDGNPSNPDANTYGVNADLNLDVAPTRVKLKTGANAGTYVTPDPLGFAVNGRIHFKEINVERLQNVHPTGGAVTAMYGIKAQNADIRANLTATPIN